MTGRRSTGWSSNEGDIEVTYFRQSDLKQIVGVLAYPESKFRTIIRIGDPVSGIVKIIRNEMPEIQRRASLNSRTFVAIFYYKGGKCYGSQIDGV